MNGQVDPNGQSAPSVDVNDSIDFSSMTDEELDNFDFENPAAQVTEPAADPAPAQGQADTQEPAKGTVIEPEKEPEPAKADNPATQQTDEQKSKLSYEALEKQYANLQQAYGRMSNEVGELRKLVPAEPTQADFDNDSVAATKTLRQREEMTAEIRTKEIQARNLQILAENAKFHQTYTPNLNANSEGIRDLLIKEESMTSEQASQFMGNLMGYDPQMVYQLNKNYEKSLKIASLEAEIARLKEQPSKMVQQMKQLNQQTPMVTSSTGESSDPKMGIISDPLSIANLSDKELDKQLEYAIKQEKLNG